MKRRSWSHELARGSTRGREDYPVGTIAFYGPTNRRASKVSVGIVPNPESGVDELERWWERSVDVRIDRAIGKEVLARQGPIRARAAGA